MKIYSLNFKKYNKKEYYDSPEFLKKRNKLLNTFIEKVEKKKSDPKDVHFKNFQMAFKYDDDKKEYDIKAADIINYKKLSNNLFLKDYVKFETFEIIENDYKVDRKFRLVFYSSFILYRFYMFLGFSTYITNFRNGSLLLGYYSKIAMINLQISQFFLRANLSFMMTLVLRKFISFIIINEIHNDVIIHGYINLFKYYDVGYYFGRWWKGFFKNYRIFQYHSSIIYAWYNFGNSLFPYYCLFLYVARYNPKSSTAFYDAEINRLQIPNTLFYDTSEASDSVHFGILSNNKTYSNNLFYIKIVVAFILRATFFKKKKFMRYLNKLNPIFFILYNLFKKEYSSKKWMDNEHIKLNFWRNGYDSRVLRFKHNRLPSLLKEFNDIDQDHAEIYFSILSALVIKKKIDKYSVNLFKKIKI
jgi:hypothetical protein